RRPPGKVVVLRGQDPRRAIPEVENAQAGGVLAPDAIDDLLAVRRVARKTRMHGAVGERFEVGAVAAHPHDRRLAMTTLLEPDAEAEPNPLASRRPSRCEGSGEPGVCESRIQAGVCRLEDALPVRSIRIHDGEGGIEILLGDDELAVP